MSGLVLKLGPKERILINGAVIENGDKRSKLNIVTPNANILRLRDALHPEEINTPVKRVCYTLQLVLSGDADPEEGKAQIRLGLRQLGQVFTDASCQSILDEASHHADHDRFYPALRSLRRLLVEEQNIIRAMN